MALVTIYAEMKQFHTYNGTTHKVFDIADAKPLISSSTTYAQLHAWAQAKATAILDGATQFGIYDTNVDTNVELVPVVDFNGYIDFSSTNLVTMVFGALNAKVAAKQVAGFVARLDSIRHFCEKDNKVSMRPRIEVRPGFTGQVHLTGCDHKPEATQHLPYALYKHLTTPYA